MHKLTQRLLSEMKSPSQRRYSEDDVRDILGGNALRVLKEGWGK
jgi:microsomal dipeptidase-like Zn-dependent dipeptidase